MEDYAWAAIGCLAMAVPDPNFAKVCGQLELMHRLLDLIVGSMAQSSQNPVSHTWAVSPDAIDATRRFNCIARPSLFDSSIMVSTLDKFSLRVLKINCLTYY